MILFIIRIKKILLFITFCFVTVFSIAQQIKDEKVGDKYRAIHWTTNNGLSQPANYCMIEDIKGFLWIGSENGLNRFDGNTFKYYFSDKTPKTSIADNNSDFGLSEDSLHNIWIGTGKGVSRYDIKADTFTSFSSPRAVTGPPPIVPFWAKKNEMLCWDANENAVISYNVHSFARKMIVKLSPTDSLGGVGAKTHYSIFDETGKSIWMLTERHKGGLLRVSLSDGKREYYPWPLSKKNLAGYRYHYVQAEAMRYDRTRNCIWINSPEGLINFTLKDKQFHQIDALAEYTNLKNYDRFVGLDLDTKGRIWFTTQPKGIIIYDPADQSVELPFPNDSAMQVDAGNFNACLYCDRDGMVWTGSWSRTGVYQVAPFSKTVTHYLAIPNTDHSLHDNGITYAAQGVEGKIWLTTRGGINIFDPVSGKFDLLTDLPGFKKNGDNHDVRPVYIDAGSRRAIIEYKGLLEMDLDTKKSLPVVFKDSAGHVIDISNESYFSRKFKHGCITRASYANRDGIFIIDVDSPVARQLLSFSAEEIDPYFDVVNDSLVIFGLKADEKEKGNLRLRRQ